MNSDVIFNFITFVNLYMDLCESRRFKSPAPEHGKLKHQKEDTYIMNQVDCGLWIGPTGFAIVLLWS